MSGLIISLTSIPSRFDHIDATLGTLLDQDLPADRVCLYLPKRYHRFGDLGALPKVPSGVEIVVIEQDYGPATKVLAAVRDYSDQEVDILFCDDDILYDRQLTRRMSAVRKKIPDAVIAEAGGTYPVDTSLRSPQAVFQKKDLSYRLKRALSLGLARPRQYLASGYVAQFCGFGGVMVRPEFFTERFFDIPEILWTVDDFWLSGCFAAEGVGIWLNADAPGKRRAPAHFIDRLVKHEEKGMGRYRANTACVDYFQKKHGIWTSPETKT